MSTSVIEFDRVSKGYKDIIAINEVSFTVGFGEIFGYIGPNGAGKTTTIKIMVGLITDFNGRCRIGDWFVPKDIDRVHKILGYMPQNVAFQDWRTVNQALTTFGKFSGLHGSELASRIDEMLALLELTDVKDKKITQLSGGMNQKIGLAQALLHAPNLLVLDEPLSGLDPASRHLMKSIIKNLALQGTTVFFSSHILSDVQDIASRIGIINKGKMIKVGTLDELTSQFDSTKKIEVSLIQHSEQWRELESLSGVLDVKEIESREILLSLEPLVDENEIMQRIMKKLLEMNCQVRSIRPSTLNLDELYIKFIHGDSD